MKRLVGGLVLLSLMAISLNKNAGETAITDEEVLDQLVNLRGFIDEQRDFTKASKGLKPVLIQYRSSASKIDGIVQCNLSFDTDALHLSIGGCSLQADGTTISILIKVVYEWTEYVGYTIKSATLTCSDTKVKVTDVKNIDGKILSQLKCGDVVIKEDTSGEHAYIVTFKSETGICLTYTDASVIETQSYDLVNDNWVYNSEDKSGNLIEDVKPIYFHPIFIRDNEQTFKRLSFFILDNQSTPYTFDTFKTKIKALMDNGALIQCNGCFISASVCYNAFIMLKEQTYYRIYGNDTEGNQSFADLDTMVASTFEDGVNKIN